LEHPHHASVKSWGVAWAKRHYRESILLVVGAKECQFFLILVTDGDLMITGFIVQTNEVEVAGRVPKVVDSIVATWNWVLGGGKRHTCTK
jgi:hypothetical protein